MADKLLKSIKFPTLPDRYVIGDASLSEEGAAADAKATGDAIADLKSEISHNTSRLKTIDGVTDINVGDFDIGNISITNSGWVYSNISSRVRTKQGTTLHLKIGDVIKLTDYTDARFFVGWYANGTYGSAGWLTSDHIVNTEGEYVILLSNITETTVSDKSTLLNLLRIDSKHTDNVDNNLDVFNETTLSQTVNISLDWFNRGMNPSGIELTSSENQITSFIKTNKNADIVVKNSSASVNLYLYAYNASGTLTGRTTFYGKGQLVAPSDASYIRLMTYSTSVSQDEQKTYIDVAFENNYSKDFLKSLIEEYTLTADDIVTGYITDDGEILPASNRTITKGFLPLVEGTNIIIPAAWGINFSTYLFDSNTKEFIEKTTDGWKSDFTIDQTGLYKILFSTTNVTNILNNISFSRKPITINSGINSVLASPIITPSDITKKRSNTIKSISHRGLWQNGHGVMCGASAVKAAKKYGYSAVENDVNITSDGKLVMWHDSDLSRIGRSDVVINQTSLSALKAIDIGTYFSTEFAGETILTFDEWINLCHLVGVDARVDFKITGASFTDALASELVSSIRRAGMINHVSYTANYDKIRQYHHDASLVFLGVATAENIISLAEYKQDGDVSFCPFAPDITETNAHLALDNGFGFESWFADYSLYSYSTKTDIFNEIYRVCNLGVEKFTLDDYTVEDVIDAKVMQ